MSLILAWGWGVIPLTLLPWVAGLILRPAGYIVGLIIGIRGRGECRASDRLGQIVAMLAIILNTINLVWTVFGALGYGLALRG